MIDDVLGAANMPLPIPFAAMSRAKAQYEKSTGSSIRPMKLPPNTTIPAVAKPRAPKRSDRVPASGTRDEEAGGEGQQEDAGPQGRVAVVVAVQRQPDPLQPDDEHELQAASGDGHDEARHVAGGEGPDAEQAELEHRLGDPGLDHDERREQQRRRRRAGR